MNQIRILLADDHTVVRQGLRMLLEAEPDLSIIGDADTGRAAVSLARKLRPNVVVMDIAMPMLNGLEATRQIVRDLPAVRVLILSSYSDDEYLKQLAAAGAAGYLLKQTAATDLIKAIREVNTGNAFFSPSVSRRLLDYCRGGVLPGAPAGARTRSLSSRQTEVLQMIAEGKTNKAMAAELGLSVKTVEKYRQQVMDKLKIHDVAGLTRYALSRGIIKEAHV